MKLWGWGWPPSEEQIKKWGKIDKQFPFSFLIKSKMELNGWENRKVFIAGMMFG
jgi:hypothetical protein